MPYERSQQIEQRFRNTIDLIREDMLNADRLANLLGVSIPTVQRMVKELKRRGYIIRSVRDGNGWHYKVENPPEYDRGELSA